MLFYEFNGWNYNYVLVMNMDIYLMVSREIMAWHMV